MSGTGEVKMMNFVYNNGRQLNLVCLCERLWFFLNYCLLSVELGSIELDRYRGIELDINIYILLYTHTHITSTLVVLTLNIFSMRNYLIPPKMSLYIIIFYSLLCIKPNFKFLNWKLYMMSIGIYFAKKANCFHFPANTMTKNFDGWSHHSKHALACCSLSNLVKINYLLFILTFDELFFKFIGWIPDEFRCFIHYFLNHRSIYVSNFVVLFFKSLLQIKMRGVRGALTQSHPWLNYIFVISQYSRPGIYGIHIVSLINSCIFHPSNEQSSNSSFHNKI